MKVLVISDVHGNLPALEFVLNENRDADLIISLGDVVNYGPWSDECVDLLDSLRNSVLLKGNHEEAFINGIYPGNNEIVKSFFTFCYPEFTRHEAIKKYLENWSFEGFDFSHTVNDEYIYPDSEIKLTRNIFIGHSHRIFCKEEGDYKLVNVGSVGQNRINTDELNFVLWFPHEKKIDLMTRKFSADLLINEMRTRGYPEICINYIQGKRGRNT